jgi:hypothetical protein
VTGVAVVNPGTGYVSPPAVTIASGVNSIGVTTPGVRYTSAPNVAISDPNVSGGTKAIATASISGGVVTGYTITNAGSGYTTTPTVTLTGGGFTTAATATASVGLGATATASIRQLGGRIQSPVPNTYVNWAGNFPLARANSREGIYLNTGTGFTWSTSQVSAGVATVSVTGGNGYTSPPKLTIVGGSGKDATAEANVRLDGSIAANVVNPGDGFITSPSVIVTGGIGLAPSGILKTIPLGTGGGGTYTSNTNIPIVNIVSGGGSGAKAIAVFGPNTAATGPPSYAVASYLITNSGSGYTSAPIVTITGGDGSGATAGAPTFDKSASGLVLTSSGSGYTSPPTVTISGGGGTGATAYATLGSGGGVSAVTIISPGTNYTTRPTVTFSGGGGSGATAQAYIGDAAVATATISILEKDTNRSYILERPVTDPTQADTDDDGFSDFDEMTVSRSNPLSADSDGDGLNDSGQGWVRSTKSVDPVNPLKPYPYGNALVYGDYEGLVMETARGMAFKQTLRLTSTGAFTGSTLRGFDADTSFSGAFSANGTYDATDKGIFSEVHMAMVHQGGNTFYIQGSYVATTGETFTFELRPARTSPIAKNLTFSASLDRLGLESAIFANAPTGAVVATTGSVAKTTGWITFNVYLPDGGRSSHAGPMVDGKLAMLYARSTSGTVLAGPVVFSPVSGQSDFNGTVRLFNTGNTGGFFAGGFDQMRSLLGSNFVPPSAGKLPLGTFTATNNNVLYQWDLGNFDGIKKVGTWSTSGVINIPRAEFDSTVTSYNASTGLITVSYTRADAGRSLEMARDVATGFAVVSQVSNTSQGFYVNGYSCGQFSIVPNTLKLVPDNFVPASISPASFKTRAAGATYPVIITATSKWSLSIPQDVTWVSAQNPISSLLNPNPFLLFSDDLKLTRIPDNDRDYISDADEDANFVQHSNPNNTILRTDKTKADTDGDGIIDGIEILNGTDPTEFDGKGNGRVVIILAKNTTGARRTAVITIAGVKHTITQDFR